MAFDNGVHFCGRLTAEPEVKEVGDSKVCNFTLARNRYVKDKDHPVADFVDCVAWNGSAEFVAKYFSKGSRVGIEGELQTRTYEDKDGNKRKVTEVRVTNISFVDSKSSNPEQSERSKTDTREPEDDGEDDSDTLPF